MKNRYQLFVDLDGVLADFNDGVYRACGKVPAELTPRQMWPVLARTPGFYDRLKWLSDGKALWDALKEFAPVVLTGVPMGKWAEPQKRSWCARELGADIPVITGMSRKKAQLAAEWMEEHNLGDCIPVLVDDSLKLKENWEAEGGRFILHLDTVQSLAQFRELGFPI